VPPLLELADPRHGPIEKRAVVRDEHHGAVEALDKALEAFEPVEVEVVRGLVQEQDVVAREQDRGEPRTRRFAARKGSHRHIETVARQAEVRREPRRPRMEIGAAERDEPLERHGVVVREALELRLGGGDAGPAGDIGEDGLAGLCVRLLLEIADRQRRRRAGYPPAIRLLEPRHDPEQRRLADPVRADDADPAAGRHRERHVREDERAGKALRDVTERKH
jgi:hypothetical protein